LKIDVSHFFLETPIPRLITKDFRIKSTGSVIVVMKAIENRLLLDFTRNIRRSTFRNGIQPPSGSITIIKKAGIGLGLLPD